MAGVPVFPQRGRGGGWQLVGGARTDLTGLTYPEVLALFSQLELDADTSTPSASALRKLLRAVPEPFRLEAEAMASAVVSDHAAWGGRAVDRPSVVDGLQAAVVRRRKVMLSYVGRGNVSTTRLVTPYGLVNKDGVWYLIAGTDRGARTFRVDRVSSFDITDTHAGRPADFDLHQFWDDVVARMEGNRSSVAATVVVAPNLESVLKKRFGRHCEHMGTLPDGRLQLRVAAHLPTSLAEALAGFGGAVDVTEPESVRSELARIGAELVERYATHAR